MDDLAEFGYFGESTTAEDTGTAFSLANAPSNLYDSDLTNERRRDISHSTFPQSSLGQGAGRSPSGIRGEIARAKAEGSGRALGQGSESDVEFFGENLVLKSIRARGIWHYDAEDRLIRSTDLEAVKSNAGVINPLESWIKNGMLRYIDTQKGREWFRSRGLQLPKEGTPRGNANLHTEADLVKREGLFPILHLSRLWTRECARLLDIFRVCRREDYNAVVELSSTKNSFEIVGWHPMRVRSLDQKRE